MTADELEPILSVHRAAFGKTEEAELVRSLLEDPSAKPLLSLLEFAEGEAAGHVLFTNVTFDPPAKLSARILAPLAVVPKLQNRGLGRALVERGLKILREEGVDLVFVLGDPAYYSRFGFKPAGARGFAATYPIDPKNNSAWMILALRPDAAAGQDRCRVVCARAMDRPEYWTE
jgi:putative acetyltransferase